MEDGLWLFLPTLRNFRGFAFEFIDACLHSKSSKKWVAKDTLIDCSIDQDEKTTWFYGEYEPTHTRETYHQASPSLDEIRVFLFSNKKNNLAGELGGHIFDMDVLPRCDPTDHHVFVWANGWWCDPFHDTSFIGKSPKNDGENHHV